MIYIKKRFWKQITVLDTTVHQQKQYNSFHVTVVSCYQQQERSYNVLVDIYI